MTSEREAYVYIQLPRNPGNGTGGAAEDDRCNLQRIEYATLDLARRCGLNVTQARLQAVGDSDVLMVRRFDREYTDKGYLRFGLVSGLTVLDCGDSYLDRERWSYPLLAQPAPLVRQTRGRLHRTVPAHGLQCRSDQQ